MYVRVRNRNTWNENFHLPVERTRHLVDLLKTEAAEAKIFGVQGTYTIALRRFVNARGPRQAWQNGANATPYHVGGSFRPGFRFRDLIDDLWAAKTLGGEGVGSRILCTKRRFQLRRQFIVASTVTNGLKFYKLLVGERLLRKNWILGHPVCSWTKGTVRLLERRQMKFEEYDNLVLERWGLILGQGLIVDILLWISHCFLDFWNFLDLCFTLSEFHL